MLESKHLHANLSGLINHLIFNCLIQLVEVDLNLFVVKVESLHVFVVFHEAINILIPELEVNSSRNLGEKLDHCFDALRVQKRLDVDFGLVSLHLLYHHPNLSEAVDRLVKPVFFLQLTLTVVHAHFLQTVIKLVQKLVSEAILDVSVYIVLLFA